MDFYKSVPKDFVENLKYRVAIRKRCETDKKLRQAVMEACRHDILYWLNAFAWLHEPRPMTDENGVQLPEVIPFITWPHQEPVILDVREKLGFQDIGIIKSRGEGMSWIALMLALQDWLFAIPGSRMINIGIISRTMDAGDEPGNMGSLLPKIDWELERLPKWMVGTKDVDFKRSLTAHSLRNLRNGSVISAYAPTGEVGSGARFTYCIMDELSKFPPGDDYNAMTSTQATTKSRLVIATPYGSEGAYYDMMHKPSGAMLRKELRWEDNPTRNRGLYRMVNNVPVAVDPVNNPLPDNYNPPSQEVLDLFSRLRKNGFRLDKGLRSPWYDNECDRADSTPFSIAQEYDRDFGGSMFKIFTEDFFEAANGTARNPFCRAHVHYDEELRPTVNKAADGELCLWMTLDTYNRPPQHSYALGVDVCTGLGGAYTSNSVIQIIDCITMEQVGEFASNTIAPDHLADLSVAICNWLGNAYLAWERNGPGAAFTARIKEIGYPSVYLRTKLFDRRRRKKSKEPGWWTDARSKEILFSELKRTVAIRELKVHSEPLVQECQQYIRIGKAIEHVANTRADKDNPDRGESHGDRVIALGIAVQALRDRPVFVGGSTSKNVIEPNSIEERDREYYESLQDEESDDWDDRTNWDLMAGSGYR